MERYKKPLSLATMRKQENPVNAAQKMASQIQTNKTEKRQWRNCARVNCHIYRRRNKYLQRSHGPWKHEKGYATCIHPESWYLEKYKTELNLNSIFKTFQGTYLISIATLKSVLCLGHFISFSFATEEVKGVNYFPSRANDQFEKGCYR